MPFWDVFTLKVSDNSTVTGDDSSKLFFPEKAMMSLCDISNPCFQKVTELLCETHSGLASKASEDLPPPVKGSRCEHSSFSTAVKKPLLKQVALG